jgi:hypothetical protein
MAGEANVYVGLGLTSPSREHATTNSATEKGPTVTRAVEAHLRSHSLY